LFGHQGIAGEFADWELEEEKLAARQYFSDREKFLTTRDPRFRAHFPFGIFGCHMCRVHNRNLSVRFCSVFCIRLLLRILVF
jgi:hypothetical protein